MATYKIVTFGMNYAEASGSANTVGAAHYKPSVKGNQHSLRGSIYSSWLFPQVSSSVTTTTIIEELTVKYYQRVYDAGTGGWCYYDKTSIDATPDADETTPNYTGAISNHSIVRILEVY